MNMPMIRKHCGFSSSSSTTDRSTAWISERWWLWCIRVTHGSKFNFFIPLNKFILTKASPDNTHKPTSNEWCCQGAPQLPIKSQSVPSHIPQVGTAGLVGLHIAGWYLIGWLFVSQSVFLSVSNVYVFFIWKAIVAHIDEKTWSLERAAGCFTKILEDSQLEFQLPKKCCLTGAILRRAFACIDRALSKHGPMVFKFGFTHDPHFRFRNAKFGYSHDPHQKWQAMVLVYVSSHATGPAFLEAALIERFKGTSNQLGAAFCLRCKTYIFSAFRFVARGCRILILGTPGCRNERDGGETVTDRGGPYFTYFVYQSFKSPPCSSGKVVKLVRSRAEPYHA